MSKADPIKVSEGDEEEEVLAVLSNLDTALSEIETHLGPLLDKSVSLKELSAQISHLENVKLYAGLAYTLNTLFFMYLKTQGVSPATHPVKPELARVQRYIEKIASVAQKPQAPPTKLDKGAAGRFVRAALAGEETKGEKAKEQTEKKGKNKGKNSETENKETKTVNKSKGKVKNKSKGKAEKEKQQPGADATERQNAKAKTKDKPTDNESRKEASDHESSRQNKRTSPVPEKEQEKEKPKQKKRKS